MNKQSDVFLLAEKVQIPVKQLNRLNREKWYHGTDPESVKNIEKIGVQVSYNIGQQLDFGSGFYLIDSYKNAENYISRVPVINADGSLEQREQWAVIEFAFNPYAILFEEPNHYTYRNFPYHNLEFAEFIFENRLRNVYHENPHGYDLIWGVMSDSLPDKVILDYKNKEITENEAVLKLQKPNSMKQLYIGNQEIADRLLISDITYIKRR